MKRTRLHVAGLSAISFLCPARREPQRALRFDPRPRDISRHDPVPLIVLPADVKDDRPLPLACGGGDLLPGDRRRLRRNAADPARRSTASTSRRSSTGSTACSCRAAGATSIPSRYGAEPRPAVPSPTTPARDASSFALIAGAIRQRRAAARHLPRHAGAERRASAARSFRKCRSMPGRDDHRAPVSTVQDERFAIRQDAILDPGGELAGALAADAHPGQLAPSPGDRPRSPTASPIEATAPDGTIEAVRVIDAPGFAIGVQWHPEYWVESDEPSARLFAAFGRAVQARMAARAAGLPPRRSRRAQHHRVERAAEEQQPEQQHRQRAADLDDAEHRARLDPIRRRRSASPVPLPRPRCVARTATVSPVPSAMTKVAATPARISPCDSAKTRMMIAPEHGRMPTARIADHARASQLPERPAGTPARRDATADRFARRAAATSSRSWTGRRRRPLIADGRGCS